MAGFQAGLRGVKTVAGRAALATLAVTRIPRRLVDFSGRKPRTAGALAGVIAFVLLAATAGFTALHIRQHSIDDARAAAMDAAQKNVPVLLSYNHKTLAGDIDARAALLTGAFKTDYADLLRQTVLPAAQQSNLVTSSTVAGAGVESDDGPDHVTLLMFVNQSTGSEGQAPSQAGSRLEVTMERSGGSWLISGLKPV